MSNSNVRPGYGPGNTGRTLNVMMLGACIAAGVVVGIGASLVAAKWQTNRMMATERERLDRRVSHPPDERPRPAYSPSTAPLPTAHLADSSTLKTTEPPAKEIDPLEKSRAIEAERASRMADLREYDDAKVRGHWSGPTDPSWAAAVTPSLRQGLERLIKDKKGSIDSIDCRNTSCIATLVWPSYDDALAEYGAIVRAPLEVNCSRGVTLPDGDSSPGPMKATVFFDCADWKAAGNQPLGHGSTPGRPLE